MLSIGRRAVLTALFVASCSSKVPEQQPEEVTTGCADGQKACGESCVAATPENGCAQSSCAPCAVPTGGSVACVAPGTNARTACAEGCPAGQKLCGGACVAPTPANGCGNLSCEPCALANVPAEAQTCTDNACDYTACPYGFEDVDGDRSNGCEAPICSLFGKRCPDGSCREGTDPSSGCSNDGCAPCDSENGVARCEAEPFGVVWSCAIDCGNLKKKCDGRCVDATTPQWGCAADSCTPCQMAHVTGPYCSLSTADCDYASCEDGWMDLDGVRTNGCEAIAGCYVGQKSCGGTERCLSDPSYGCGDPACSPCSWPASLQGQPTCVDASGSWTCGLACNAGYKACGGDCARETRDNGCGEPGCSPCSARLQNVVSGSISCSGTGRCDYGVCQTGYEDLDGDRSNGCETRNPKTVRLAWLQLWVRGDAGLVPSGSEFVWHDQSGRGRDADPAGGSLCSVDPDTGEESCITGAPARISSSFNGTGRPYLRFGTAADGHAQTSASIESIFDSDYTIFVVTSREHNLTNRYAIGTGGEARNQSLGIGYRSGTAYTFDQWSNGLDVEIAPYPGSGTQLHRAVVRFSFDQGHYLRVTDGAGVVHAASNQNKEPLQQYPWSLPGLRIGKQLASSEPLNGGVAEVIVYNAALTDADIAIVENYLRRKWGF